MLTEVPPDEIVLVADARQAAVRTRPAACGRSRCPRARARTRGLRPSARRPSRVAPRTVDTRSPANTTSTRLASSTTSTSSAAASSSRKAVPNRTGRTWKASVLVSSVPANGSGRPTRSCQSAHVNAIGPIPSTVRRPVVPGVEVGRGSAANPTEPSPTEARSRSGRGDGRTPPSGRSSHRSSAAAPRPARRRARSHRTACRSPFPRRDPGSPGRARSRRSPARRS